MMRKKKKEAYSYGGKARSPYMMGGYRMEKAEGGKVYSNIRDMEKACMGPDYTSL